jgi:hypothetical protein
MLFRIVSWLFVAAFIAGSIFWWLYRPHDQPRVPDVSVHLERQAEDDRLIASACKGDLASAKKVLSRYESELSSAAFIDNLLEGFAKCSANVSAWGHFELARRILSRECPKPPRERIEKEVQQARILLRSSATFGFRLAAEERQSCESKGLQIDLNSVVSQRFHVRGL